MSKQTVAHVTFRVLEGGPKGGKGQGVWFDTIPPPPSRARSAWDAHLVSGATALPAHLTTYFAFTQLHFLACGLLCACNGSYATPMAYLLLLFLAKASCVSCVVSAR
jgi:hypothetical protein